MNKDQFVASSYLVDQHDPVSGRRVRALVLALALAALVGLNVAQEPQSASAFHFVMKQPSASTAVSDGAEGALASDGGADTDDDSLKKNKKL